MTPGGQAQPRLATSNFNTFLVTRSDRLLHSKTVSPAVCPTACHTTLRNPIVTLGMRDTAERRGAPGPTDSRGRRTQAQQQQQRRALTVRRGAPQAPAKPAGRPSSNSNSTSTASRHHFYLHSDVWATGGEAWHWMGLFPGSGPEKETAIKNDTFGLTSGSNLSLCLVQNCRRYFRQNISVKGSLTMPLWPQHQPIILASCKL